MSKPIIEVKKISKCYQLGTIGATRLRDDLERVWHRVTGKAKKVDESEFWALRDVSFEVYPGEVVGIIGRNGAGKSTLLKVLSRITDPTSGEIILRGRVASLLEVGTGFHPDLSGRENIFLNGAILGMSKAEIRSKFDEIVDFAEIEKFIDTPVKRYSSGMYVRLAFAVAAHLEPEILVIDEVLAVGDMQFQQKCLGKMQEVSKRGRTVLFVSHHIPAVLQLTTKAVLLVSGAVAFSGKTENAINLYSAGTDSKNLTHYDLENVPRKYGTNSARLTELWFDRSLPIFRFDEAFNFCALVKALEDVESLRVSMTIFSNQGTPIGSCFSSEAGGLSKGQVRKLIVSLGDHRLAPGKYYCGLAIGKGDHKKGHVDYDVVLDTLYFEVLSDTGESGGLAYWPIGWGTSVYPPLSLRMS